MLYSWKLAYTNIANYVEGHDLHITNNISRCSSAESLDHVINEADLYQIEMP